MNEAERKSVEQLCVGHIQYRNAKCTNCSPMWSNRMCKYYIPYGKVYEQKEVENETKNN